MTGLLNLKISWIVWTALAALAVYAVIRLIGRGRGVNGTLAWLFAIVAFPGVGPLAYVMMAGPNFKRFSRRRRVAAEVRRRALRTSAPHASLGSPGEVLTRETTALFTMTASVTGLWPSAGNHVEVLVENDDAYLHIREALVAAQKSIWAESYIIRNDETGRTFLDLLTARAREGLEVKLLYDAIGSFRLDGAHLKALKAAGGRIAAFLPINPLRLRFAGHLRNHRKIIIVDGDTGYTGSLNVGNEYSWWNRWKRGTSFGRGRGKRRERLEEPSPSTSDVERPRRDMFKDAHLAIHGPAVEGLSQTFAEDWVLATGETLVVSTPPSPAGGGSVVAVVPSGPDQEHNANALVFFTGITSARERCYLTTPYFVPDEPLVQALVSAALRGVDVRILMPERSDVALIVAAARSYYPGLLQAGVRIFEYRNAMLHAKTMVVDRRWAFVGSANMDIRSFQWNFEVGALVADPAIANQLEIDFRRDLQESGEVTEETLGAWTWRERAVQRIARLLSPML